MEATAARFPFHGGMAGALAPFALFLAGVTWLGLSGAPDERGFWPILLAALALGLLLARDRRAYAENAVRGMSRPIVMLMVLAWMLAGVLSALMSASGFVDALIAAARAAGVSGGGYVAVAFLICCAVSTATGTSLGTIMLCAPLLYPAGADLAAAPAVLIGAILAGATFGDNISPVSDTTIASATTQEADMGGVVRSRLRYALPAAAAALAGFVALGGGAAEPRAAVVSGADPLALLMLASPLLVIVMLLARRHLLEGMLAGIFVALVLGLALGRLQPGQVFYLDLASYGARGLIVDGIDRAVGVSVFSLLLMALVAGLESAGLTEKLVAGAGRSVRGPRGAELWLFGVVSAAVLLTTHSVVAILTVGAFGRNIGERFGIDRYRRANLLDLTVCTYPFLLPYFIPTVLAASTTRGTDGAFPAISPALAGLWNLHSWSLLVVVLLAIATGWGRRSTGERV